MFGLGKKKNTSSDVRMRESLVTLSEDRRLQCRYFLGEGIAALAISESLNGTVKDISYSGIAAYFTTEGDPEKLNLPISFRATMTFLDKSAQCNLTVVRRIPQDAAVLFGCSFRHTTPEALFFLREFIEPMRRANTLVKAGPAALPELISRDRWETYHGDGPTELTLQRSVTGDAAATALLTFRHNDVYLDVLFKDGKIRTHAGDNKDIDPTIPATLGRMGTAEAPDSTILRPAVYHLLGLPDGLRETAQPFIEAARAALKQGSGLAAA